MNCMSTKNHWQMHMNEFQAFTNELKDALSHSLPGTPAHYMLAPEYRKSLLLQTADISNAQLSSVLILFFPDADNKPSIALIRRVEYQGVHSGQISFPGGKAEPSDHDLYDTALRETWEEIGVKRDSIEILGVLTELYVPPSNFLIFPVVASMYECPAFIANSEEVAEILTVPFDFFFSDGALGTYITKTSENKTVQVPGFMIDNHLVWGATAMILSELLMVARSTTLYG